MKPCLRSFHFSGSPLPDVVHLGKSFKCSWANWFTDLEGAKSSLVLIRTLYDSAGPDVVRSYENC